MESFARDVHERERELQKLGNVDPKAKPKQAAELSLSEPKLSQYADQRVAVAIDVQNLYYGAKDIYGTKVAYQKFLDKILNGRKLIRAIAYIANRNNSKQDSFVKLMRNIGCDVRQKQVVERASGFKCNWDVEITVDAMAISSKIDTFVLASGDGDFVYLIKTLKSLGVRTEIMAFKANTSRVLSEEADQYNDVTKDVLISDEQAWKNRPKKQDIEEWINEDIPNEQSSNIPPQ